MLPALTMQEIADHYKNVIVNSDEYKTNSATSCFKEELLLPKFRDVIKNELIVKCKDKGINILPKETFRTNALQIHYYTTGASKIKFNGMHHYGIAWDLLCLDNNGQVIDKGDDPEYARMREIASSLGIHLVGTWDAGHMQGIPISQQNALRNFISNYSATEFKGYILQYGTENHFVGNLKVALQKLGYLSEEYDTQNYFFGSATDEAVRKFQKANNLENDGIVGKDTILALKNAGHDFTT